MKLSIAVPWYKSKDSVRPLYEQCLAAFTAMPDFDDIEFIFVEDCGGDGTWEAIMALAQHDARVKAYRLARNFGQHHALTACLDLCGGDWVVVMDCDLQDRPDEIPNLYAKSKEGFDMVCARRGERQDSAWRIFSSRYFVVAYNWLSGLSIDGEVANFRIMRRNVVEAYRNMREVTRNMPTQLMWLGFNTGYINVSHGARHSGKSSYTLAKLIGLALDSIIAYSNKPLRISIALGALLTLFSLCMATYILIQKLFFSIPIDGWASLMISLWFIGGMIIGNLGLIGIYLGRVYDESKHRPLYIIAERSVTLPSSNNLELHTQ